MTFIMTKTKCDLIVTIIRLNGGRMDLMDLLQVFPELSHKEMLHQLDRLLVPPRIQYRFTGIETMAGAHNILNGEVWTVQSQNYGQIKKI